MWAKKINAIRPIKDHIIVKDMNFGQRTLSSGIIMLGDDAKTDGIRPRWAQVYAIGPTQVDVTVGQWVLVEHGRWTRGNKVEIAGEEMTIRRVDSKSILLLSDDEPNTDDNISTSVHAEAKQRAVYE
jgi:co-chaperonin GroES (HSP10)